MTAQGAEAPSRRAIPTVIVSVLLAAFTAQTALPAIHSARTESAQTAASPRPAAPALLATAIPAIEAPAASPVPHHDPSTCAVCRSLVRGNAALPVAPQAQQGSDLELAADLQPEPACARVALSSHRPRAPPADSFLV